MKTLHRTLFFLICSFTTLIFPINPTELLLNTDNTPTPALKQLLETLSVEHNGTLESIVKATQKAWLRPRGVERWEMKERYPEKRWTLFPLFEELGLIHTILPEKHYYKYVFVHANVIQSFRRRLAFLIGLWNLNYRFGTIIFLCGARPLHPEEESDQMLLNNTCKELPFKQHWAAPTILPTVETGMMKLVFDQTILPDEMLDIPVFFFEAPMIILKDGSTTRPTTATTLLEWIKTSPYPGDCLFVSDQPYVGYQNAVARSYVPETFSVETVGVGIKQEEKISVFLDVIARFLYQELQRQKTTAEQTTIQKTVIKESTA